MLKKVTSDNLSRISALADECVELMRSPDPETIWTCTPGICRCPGGRLIASGGFRGPGVPKLDGIRTETHQGKIYISDNKGLCWSKSGEYPYLHARPFVVGDKVYLLGHSGDLMIMVSDDWGESWSEPVKLTEGQSWHQSACNVHYANDCVYIVMERNCYDDCNSWCPSVLAPVLMRGRIGDDLTKRENWTFASEVAFRDAFDDKLLIDSGVQFYPINEKADYFAAPKRESAPPGWLETNVTQIYDPQHYWYDPEMKTLHLLARLHNGGTGYAAMLCVKEMGDKPGTGEMVTTFQKQPSGGECKILPLPGGQMRFHVLYDEVSKLYWLLNTQATDSMTRAEFLDDDRYNLPNNQRTRLVLHFSKNLVDWCFAGLVTARENELESRHYACMTVDGDDLCILSRSGDSKAVSAHNGNLITFHKVKNFRDLVY